MKIIIGFLPVLLLTLFIYKKDKHKESLYMIILLLLGGIFSAIFSYTVSEFIKPIVVNNIVLKNLLFIGFKEEFIKFIVLFLMCFNATFLALGFIFVENIIYIYDLKLDLIEIVLRSVMSCGIHFALGVIMGYFLGYAKDNQVNSKYLNSITDIFLAFLIPTILHGLYNLLISLSMTNSDVSLFVVFYVFCLFTVSYILFTRYLKLRNNNFVSFNN